MLDAAACRSARGIGAPLRRPGALGDVLWIAITQTGATADALAAARLVQESGAPLVAITNTIGSAIIRVADGVLYLQAGPESDVVATKTLATPTTVLYLLGQYLGQLRGTVPLSGLQATLEAMLGVPRQMRDELERADEARGPIAAAAAQLATCHSWVFIGRQGRIPDRT